MFAYRLISFISASIASVGDDIGQRLDFRRSNTDSTHRHQLANTGGLEVANREWLEQITHLEVDLAENRYIKNEYRPAEIAKSKSY
jgi:hypothetical protein